MWKEIEKNRIEKYGDKTVIITDGGIELIDFEKGKVSVSPFRDLPALMYGLAWNIREGEKFSTIHKGKLYFIAEYQEDYNKGDALAYLDLESGEFEHAFFMAEITDQMGLSDLMLDSDDSCFCIGTVKREEGYTQCIICPEPGFIYGISKNTGKLEQLTRVDDIADDIRIVMGDYYDGAIHFIMGNANEPESEYKKYKGFVDCVVLDNE